MAKRTDQELDDGISGLFGHKRWSPFLAQRVLARDANYDPPDDDDILASVGRLIASEDISEVFAGDTDMQTVYVTTAPLPSEPSEPG